MAEEKPFYDNTNTPTSTTKPKKCPECGMLNSCVRETCKKCGATLPVTEATVRCPECGEHVEVSAEKCKFCGLPIEEVKARTTMSFAASTDSNRNVYM